MCAALANRQVAFVEAAQAVGNSLSSEQRSDGVLRRPFVNGNYLAFRSRLHSEVFRSTLAHVFLEQVLPFGPEMLTATACARRNTERVSLGSHREGARWRLHIHHTELEAEMPLLKTR